MWRLDNIFEKYFIVYSKLRLRKVIFFPLARNFLLKRKWWAFFFWILAKWTFRFVRCLFDNEMNPWKYIATMGFKMLTKEYMNLSSWVSFLSWPWPLSAASLWRVSPWQGSDGNLPEWKASHHFIFIIKVKIVVFRFVRSFHTLCAYSKSVEREAQPSCISKAFPLLPPKPHIFIL